MTVAALERVVVETSFGGVELHADFEKESYYVILNNPRPDELAKIRTLLVDLNLEMMEEDECPSELLSCGAVLVWCAKIDGAA